METCLSLKNGVGGGKGLQKRKHGKRVTEGMDV